MLLNSSPFEGLVRLWRKRRAYNAPEGEGATGIVKLLGGLFLHLAQFVQIAGFHIEQALELVNELVDVLELAID